jgi:hypothetical protein
MRQLALKIAHTWGAGIFETLICIGMLFLLGENLQRDLYLEAGEFLGIASEPFKWIFFVTGAVFVVIPCFIVGQVAVPLLLLLNNSIAVQLIWVVGGVGFCTVVAAQAVRVLLGPFGEKTETAYWWATAFFGVLLPCALLSAHLAAMNMPIFLLS